MDNLKFQLNESTPSTAKAFSVWEKVENEQKNKKPKYNLLPLIKNCSISKEISNSSHLISPEYVEDSRSEQEVNNNNFYDHKRESQAFQLNSKCCEHISKESWSILLEKDFMYSEQRNKYVFDKHIEILHHRYRVLDWIMDICSFYKFHRETYYLTMAYFDEYLFKIPSNKILKKELQLLGLTSLFIATKIEEKKTLPIQDILFLCDKIYSADQVLQAEKYITKILEWKCYPSTANSWLLRFIHATEKKVSQKEYKLCTKLLDVATFDLRYLKFPSSVIAATCLKLVILEEVLPTTLCLNLSLKKVKCRQWLSNYWQEICYSDQFGDLEKPSYNIELNNCPRFPKLSLIQTYNSSIDVFNLLKPYEFFH